ncbi:MAG: DNA-binding response OmpR family regulator, partial [Alteromonadaceae bacterium]
QLAAKKLPDLVISDVMMPGISGFEVLRQLKQQDLTSHIPVVLLTAKGDIDSRLKGWSEKADEYLEKPFNATELLMRLDNLLSIRSLLRQRYLREFNQPGYKVEALSLPDTGSRATSDTDNSDDDNEDIAANVGHQRFFERLDGILEKHYADELLDVTVLAGQMYMSHRQLGRKMKALLGLTPVESIRQFRLKKAAELLNQGTQSGLVAEQVGFSSHSYFSKCFKAHFKCLPSHFGR